jgi:hypothetical protein
MGNVDVAVTGSGSLATEFVHALAVAANVPLTVAVLGRDPLRLLSLVRSAAASSGALARRVTITPVLVDWSNQNELDRNMAKLRPKILVHTASLQSPWALAASNRWSTLVKSAGYGITLPLQTVLALKIGRAINQESPTTKFVNACYPDAVNRVLQSHKVNVVCGIGNVAILALLLRAELAGGDDRRLRVIGHHAHVEAAIQGQKLAQAPLRAWIDTEPIHAKADRWLETAHLPANLNRIASATAVPMTFALLGRESPWHGHAAGPWALPGGYPVIVDSDHVRLDLPEGVTLTDATALNQAGAIADGVVVNDNGEVELTERSAQALERCAGNSGYVSSWHASDVERQASRLLTLRESEISKRDR